MQFHVVFITSRYAVIELINEGFYETNEYNIYINNVFYKKSNKVIQTIDNLRPDTYYEIAIGREDLKSKAVVIVTEKEFVTLNVKKFGAKGDGKQEDTVFIQCAINSCPRNGRVLIPEGIYRITSLFLKSDITIELSKGATLLGIPEREKIPVLPGLIERYDEQDEYNLGTWEGNPLSSFASIITGIHVKNVLLCGEGVIDGNANYNNWWNNPKTVKTAYRPRTIFLNHCENITLLGITVTNSPSWCIHPYFSKQLKFIDLNIVNPKDSPNTDGLNPESSKDILILGVYFSLGDDCIAIKSGKLYMGEKHKTPSENIEIRQCFMGDGHGSVTIGSEMAGGVKNITVKECVFSHTDRGLRIKTRRGRGKDGVIDQIIFDSIYMDHVMTPIVINSFYYCDPDGHSEYVRSKTALSVDDKTPSIKTLTFRNLSCNNCHVAAAYIYGLPEQKINKITFHNVSFLFASEPKSGAPAMMDGITNITCGGIYAYNIEELEFNNVSVMGTKGKILLLEDVNQVHMDDVTREQLESEDVK